MVTMTTIQPPSAFMPFLVKMLSKITQFQILTESTIFNLKAVNFVQ